MSSNRAPRSNLGRLGAFQSAITQRSPPPPQALPAKIAIMAAKTAFRRDFAVDSPRLRRPTSRSASRPTSSKGAEPGAGPLPVALHAHLGWAAPSFDDVSAPVSPGPASESSSASDPASLVASTPASTPESPPSQPRRPNRRPHRRRLARRRDNRRHPARLTLPGFSRTGVFPVERAITRASASGPNSRDKTG